MRSALVFVLVCCLLSCATPGPIGAACQVPPPDSDWAVSEPATLGFDAHQLCAALEAVATTRANVHGLLIERHGQLLAEVYRHGPDRPIDVLWGAGAATDTRFDVDSLHDLRSITKTVTGLLAGVASGDGAFPELDAGVVEQFDGLGRCADDATQVTVEQVLTMSTGLEWHEWGRSPLTSDETALMWASNTPKLVLERHAVAPPGTRFNYNGGNTALVGRLLERRTGQSVEAFAKARLFTALHIEHWSWAKDGEGRALTMAGLRLRPRDALKLGRLLLDDGRWQGTQVVPSSWVRDSLRPVIGTGQTLFSLQGEEASYARQLWAGHFTHHGRQLDWFSGIGNGGQRLLVVPALDLTVLMLAGDYGDRDIWAAEAPLITAILDALE